MKDTGDIFKVSSIFSSIQGEGKDTGRKTIFIRFYGCSLGCTWCDQPESMVHIENSDLVNFTMDDVIKKVHEFSDFVPTGCTLGHRIVSRICITGGEPLEQGSKVLVLAQILGNSGFDVNIETNGYADIPFDPEVIFGADRKYRFTMDVKLPSAFGDNRKKAEEVFHRCISNVCFLDSDKYGDEVKFVIANMDDLNYVDEAIKFIGDAIGYNKLQYILSPALDDKGNLLCEAEGLVTASGKELIRSFIINNNFKDNVRIGYQLHKILGFK